MVRRQQESDQVTIAPVPGPERPLIDPVALAMLEKICRCEGFGAVLAGGVREAAARIGNGAERFAIEVNDFDTAIRNGQ